MKPWRKSPPEPDPTLDEAEQRVSDVERRARRVLADRKLWAQDPWTLAVLHSIRVPKG